MYSVFLGIYRKDDPDNGLGKQYSVSRVQAHESYNNQGHNDIAIIKLTERVSFDAQIQIACLPSRTKPGFPTKVNSDVYVNS